MVDPIDAQLIEMLSANARTSIKELATNLNMSPPATAERLRRLTERGIVRRFAVDIDRETLGYGLEVIVRIRPLPARAHIVEKLIRENPAIVECDRVTGDDCYFARVVLRSIRELETVMSDIADNAMTSTAVVKSQLVQRRLPILVMP